MTGPEITELVLVLVCAAAIITVLIVAGWRRESGNVKRWQAETSPRRTPRVTDVTPLRFGDQQSDPRLGDAALWQVMLHSGAIDRSAGRDRQGQFDADTERAIAQALGVVRDPIMLVGLVQPQRREGGAQ